MSLSACADADALSAVTLAPALLLPEKSPHSISPVVFEVYAHLGWFTFAIRSPLAARAQDTVPVAVHTVLAGRKISVLAEHGASPLHTSTKPPPHATVAVPEVWRPSTAVNVPLTATGAHPVHMRPTMPPLEQVQVEAPAAQLPAPAAPQFGGHLGRAAHAARCSCAYALAAAVTAAFTSGSAIRSEMGASS